MLINTNNLGNMILVNLKVVLILLIMDLNIILTVLMLLIFKFIIFLKRQL